MRVLWRSLDSMMMSPPWPPSPPLGPPRGTNFSRRKATQPLPPPPAFTRILASSMNMDRLPQRARRRKSKFDFVDEHALLRSYFLQLFQRFQFIAQSVSDRLLRIHAGDAGLDPAICVNHDVSWEGVHAEKLAHVAIGVAILRPIHIFRGHKITPSVGIIVGADADQDQTAILVFFAKVF